MSDAELHNRILDFLNAVNGYFLHHESHVEMASSSREIRRHKLLKAGYDAEDAGLLSEPNPIIAESIPSGVLSDEDYHHLDFPEIRVEIAAPVIEQTWPIVEALAQEDEDTRGLRRFVRDVEQHGPEAAYKTWRELELDLENIMLMLRKRCDGGKANKSSAKSKSRKNHRNRITVRNPEEGKLRRLIADMHNGGKKPSDILQSLNDSKDAKDLATKASVRISSKLIRRAIDQYAAEAKRASDNSD